MENQDVQGAEGVWKTPRWLRVLAVAGFSVSFVVHLLRGRWVSALFFVATLLLFLLGKRIDDWPKRRRYLAIFIYVMLAVAMTVEIVWQVKALL